MRAGDRVRVQKPHGFAGMSGDVVEVYAVGQEVRVRVRLYAWGKRQTFAPDELRVESDTGPVPLSVARICRQAAARERHALAPELVNGSAQERRDYLTMLRRGRAA